MRNGRCLEQRPGHQPPLVIDDVAVAQQPHGAVAMFGYLDHSPATTMVSVGTHDANDLADFESLLLVVLGRVHRGRW